MSSAGTRNILNRATFKHHVSASPPPPVKIYQLGFKTLEMGHLKAASTLPLPPKKKQKKGQQ